MPHIMSALQRQVSSQHASTRTRTLASPATPCWQPKQTSLRLAARRTLVVRAILTSDQDTQRTIAKPKTGRIVLESQEELQSTAQHRAIVWGCTGLLGLLALHGVMEIESTTEAVVTAASVVAAYYLADFGTGVYHWSVDNYGDGNTPIVGGQIAAFQGHHQRPWTITEREFCNNVHKVFQPALPFSALFLLLTPWTPAPLQVSMAVFIWLVCMSQQFHAWSHMKASDLHPAVLAMQDAGLLISRRAHGAHHKAPFEGNYCIVSGVWNEFLDDGGSDQGFFRQLERVVYSWTGVEPRCWSEPNYELFDGYYKDGSNIA